MVPEKDRDPDIFALDKTLRRLGLWREQSLRKQTPEARKATIDAMDFSEPLTMTRSGYDEDGYQAVMVTSSTSYDSESGIFDDKVIYWRHLPETNGNPDKVDKEDYHVLHFRGIRNPEQDPSEIPEILPDQVWVNGSLIFNGPNNGGKHDPHQGKHRRTIARVQEISKQVKEMLNRGEPVTKIGRIFSGPHLSMNFAAKALGGQPLFRGMNDKGEWDPFERLIHKYFTDIVQGEGEQLRFTLPSVDNMNPVDRLKAVHGMNINTLEPVRSMTGNWDEHATDLQSGAGYLTSIEYEQDPDTGRHVFRVLVAPEDLPSDMDSFEPYTIARMEYDQDGDSFTLAETDFMEAGPGKFKSFPDALSVFGFIQASNHYLSERKYPPYRDIAFKHHLGDRINEMHIPPPLAEGGETTWTPLYGTSLEKKFEQYGDGLGGGNLLMQRGTREDGTIDEIAVLQGLPYEPSGPNSNFDGGQPDIMQFRDALRRGVIVVDHIHFDHSTIEYYAKQTDEHGKGWLQGQKILCKDYDYYVMRHRLNTLEVPKEQWPEFIVYDDPKTLKKYPDLHKISDDEYVYRIRDDEGRVRFNVQICKNGTIHSALTDAHMITGGVDNQFNDTYYIDNDALGATEHGTRFAGRGQLALAEYFDDVDGDALLAAARSPEELYISLEECTSLVNDGHAPKTDRFKDTLRGVEAAIPDDFAMVFVPFSTNHLEYQEIREVWAEEGSLRNSTAVGANAEIRDTAMNIHGVNPYLDLREEDIPHDKLPQLAYDTALKAVDQYMKKREDRAKEMADKTRDKRTKRDFLSEDVPYQVFKHIRKTARKQIKDSGPKPAVLHEAFFNADEDIFEKYCEQLELPKTDKERKMPKVVHKALEAAYKSHKDDLEKQGVDNEADTTFWMMRSIVNHGRVEFQSKGAHNDYNMYLAIMAGQEKAARHGVRTSKRAKGFRDDYGKLGVITTGPIGSAEEAWASLSRFFRGDSLFDYDEVVRNTGYKLDPEKMILGVTQTPSMGSDAELAQSSMLREGAKRRDVTIFAAFRNGFRVINPKQHRTRFENHFRDLGWNVEWDGANGELRVHDQLFHRNGHRFFHDMVDKMKAPSFKPKLLEGIHIANWPNYQKLKEAAKMGGKRVSIDKPDDHVTRRYAEDEKTGQPHMQDMDYLTPRYRLIQRKAKYGQQYGWVVNMLLALGMRRKGGNRADPLAVRSHPTGYFEENTANVLPNDWVKAHNGASARQKIMGPSAAVIQRGGGRPMGPSAASMLRVPEPGGV